MTSSDGPGLQPRREDEDMTVIATITQSVDGYIAGPDDGPSAGLGIGGERLHYWVFGGPWSYDDHPDTAATGEDKAFLDEAMARGGASVCGRWMYEAAGHWGDENPWGMPVFVVTHRPEEQPAGGAFTFVDGVSGPSRWPSRPPATRTSASRAARTSSGRRSRPGWSTSSSIITAPVVLGGGKRLFDGFTKSVDLEHVGVRQSPYATFVTYRVRR